MVGQSRPQAEPVMWLAPDTPAASVYVPFYPAAGGKHAPAYSIGTLQQFSRESAFWAFDFVANWASLANWRNASGQFVTPLRAQFHKEIAQEMHAIEQRARVEGLGVLAEWQTKTQQRVVDRWWRLADELVVTYNDGFYNDAETNRMGLNLGYPEWWARQIGFNQDVHPIFVKRDESADAVYLADPALCPPGFRSTESPLPAGYDFKAAMWLAVPSKTTLASNLPSVALTASGMLQWATMIGALLVGISIGRFHERKNHGVHASSYQRLL